MKIITAIEITSNSIKLAQTQSNLELPTLFSDEVQFQNQTELTSELKKLSQKYKLNKSSIITVLPRHQVFLKKITVPPGNAAEIKNILKYEAERYLPFPIDLSVIDFYPVKPLTETESNEICLVAAKRETIDKHLEIFRIAGLIPDVISISSLAINNIINLQNGQDALAFIKFDDTSWEINVVYQKQLIISRGFSIPTEQGDYLDTVKNEITNSVNMFYTAISSVKIDKIYFSQDKSDYISKLHDVLTVPLVEFNLNDTIPKSFLIPFGLILPSQQQVNLIPSDIKEAVIIKHKRKLQLTSSIAIIAGILILCSAILGIKYYKSSANRKMIKTIEQNKKEILELARVQNHLETINHFKENNTLSLEILKSISQNLPSGVYIRQLSYDNKENTVLIRCRAGSYGIASKTVSQLGKSKYFTQVSNKGSYATKVGDKDLVDFEIICNLKRETTK